MKQYIKFNPQDSLSVDKAIQYAKKLGYKEAVYMQDDYKFNGILCLSNGEYYFSYFNEKEMINMQGTKLKIPDIQWVYVSDTSEEHALKKTIKRILISKVGVTNICVDSFHEKDYFDGKFFNVCSWRYVVPVPTEEKKERKLMMTDSEWEKFQKSLLNNL